MKYTIGIIYIAIGIFMAYITVSEYLADKEIYRIILSYTTESRNTFLGIRGGIALIIVLMGMQKIKKINDSRS